MNKAIALIFALALILVSCGDPQTESLSDDDIKDMVEADMQTLESTVQDVGEIASVQSGICGSRNDSSISKNSQNGNFQMTATWSWEVLCQNNIPADLDIDLNGNSSFNNGKISSEASLLSNFILSNLISQIDYQLNGSLRANADVTTSRRQSRTYDSETTYTLDQVNFDRTTYEIQSGTVQLTTKGNFNNGGSFDRSATLVFNGNGSATLTLDNGTVYTINF